MTERPLGHRLSVLLLLLAIGVPIALLAYVSVSLSTAATTREAERGVTSATGESAVYVHQRIQNVSDQLTFYGQSQIAPLMSDSHDLPRLQDRLTEFRTSNGGIAATDVTDVNGRLLASAPANESQLGRYLIEDEWYQRVTVTGQTYVTGVIHSPSGIRSIQVAAPIRSGPGTATKVIGYLVGMYDLGPAQRLVDDFAQARGISITLVDRRGQVLAAPHMQPGAYASSNDPNLSSALAGQTGVNLITTTGTPLFTAYAPVAGSGWAVLGRVPSGTTLSEAENLRRTIVAFAAVLAAIVTMGALAGLKLVSRRSESMARQGRAEALGQLDEAAREIHQERGEDALRAVARAAVNLVPSDLAGLAVLRSQSTDEFESVVYEGRLSTEDGVAPRLETTMLGMLAGDPLVRLHSTHQQGAGGPLIILRLDSSEGEVLGIVFLARPAGARPFDDEQAARLRLLGHHAVTAIERAHQERALGEKDDQLSRSSQLKGEFLASMSHELRTPLSAIIGFSDLMLDGSDGALSEEQREDLGQINSSGRILLRLVNDILDLSKIEAGRMSLEISPVDLASVMREVTSGLRPLAMAKSLDLKVEVLGEVPLALGDAMRVRQILTNLVSNAIKFTDQGSVTVQCLARGETIEVSVIDTGIGIQIDAVERIFEEFTQADGTTSRRFGGTGLGLAITRRLLQMQGGEIGVESTLGLGSRFWFALPRSGDQHLEAGGELESPFAAQAPAHRWAGQTQNLILIVDDEEPARQLLTRRLEEFGFATTATGAGHDAIRIARELHPALITLDIMMPDTDGWRVLEALKSDPLTTDIPVVVISIVDGKDQAMAMGAASYITKPVGREELTDTVRNILPRLEGADVLCVDDNGPVLDLVRRHLQAAGARARTAASGAAALAEAERQVPDAILVDLTMPEMSGFELVSRLRTRPTLQRTPILVLSGRELSEEDASALGPNIDRFIRKSEMRAADLATTIGQAIDHRRHLSRARRLTSTPDAITRLMTERPLNRT